MAGGSDVKVVRVQNIPRGQTDEEFRQLLSDASGPDIQIQANLSPSCCRHDGSQIAIVKCKPRLPDFLSALEADRVGASSYYISLGGVVYSFDKHFFGLTQLYPTDSTRAVSADIVAVTGLNGAAFDSWRGGDPHGQMWLQNFFSVHLPSVRTMIYGYNTQWDSKGIGTVTEFVEGLSLELRNARPRQTQSFDRPLIFIGHGFGAIVVARLLMDWKYNDVDQFIKSAFGATRAVFLFGAPHRGMDISGLIEMAKEKSADHRMKLLQSLGFESLDKLVSEAEKFAELTMYFKLFSGYEARLTHRVAKTDENKSGYSRSGQDFNFVHKKSAVLGLPHSLETRIPVDADHFNLVKFGDPSNQTYQTVLQYIQNLLNLPNFDNSPNTARGSEITALSTQLDRIPKSDEATRNSRVDASRTPLNARSIPPTVGEAVPSSISGYSQQTLESTKTASTNVAHENLQSNAIADSSIAMQSPVLIYPDDIPPLHRACRVSDLDDAVKIIDQLGSNRAASLRDDTGKSALHHAVAGRSWEVVLSLLDRLSEFDIIHAKDSSGKTPLHYAAQYGYIDVLDSLVRASRNTADYIRTKDDVGNNALDLSRIYGHKRSEIMLQGLLNDISQ